jgi:hypothetical protein
LSAKDQNQPVFTFPLDFPSTNTTPRTAKSILESQGPVRPCANLNWGSSMQDLTMLFYTVIFFAVAFLYVKACQKLR